MLNQREQLYIQKQPLLSTIFLRTTESSVYCPAGFIDSEDGMGNKIVGSWRDEEQSTGLDPLLRVGSNRFV